ncbi:hypothetical protein PCC6912_50610 [Chlorogloeopsis fritschii PCC 6912]|uniref:Uncharacterized protein n=1 Tax=Chlorogloeopsis fritschii PCC 6912 TaxID=211165 RepID=A0A3S0ZL05_CHLFR|nr:hypothetical protein [Chlorogloeopsis fritschii]RUR74883.1 hypothetical protein PCC6912_50610 [Chlorogloeopsis fritschii PCC 6912]
MSLTTAVTTKKYDSLIECPRCCGQGYIQAYSHIKGGVCFLCAGAKVIELRKKYIKKDKIVCRFIKGHCHQYDANWKLQWVYKETISVSFDGGETFEFVRTIEDNNREQMRSLWLWCKQNGAEMLQKNKDLETEE